MREAQEQILDRWAASLDTAVVLRYATTGHPADDAFIGFANRVARSSKRVSVKKDPDAQVERPTLFAGPRILYQALPDERELTPFLQALGNLDALGRDLDQGVRESLGKLTLPAPLSVFITPGCPYCPAVVASLLGLAARNENVWVTVIDGAAFPDVVEEKRITAAPTVILDDQLRWTGPVEVGEVVSMMLDRDPLRLSAGALKGMIEAGAAVDAARMMMARRKIFPAFIELLSHPRWSVRLGAMVAFETLADAAPALAGEAVPALTSAYPALADPVKGDVLYVLGISGNRDVLPFLRDVAENAENEEVRSAAVEAIEALTPARGGD